MGNQGDCRARDGRFHGDNRSLYLGVAPELPNAIGGPLVSHTPCALVFIIIIIIDEHFWQANDATKTRCKLVGRNFLRASPRYKSGSTQMIISLSKVSNDRTIPEESTLEERAVVCLLVPDVSTRWRTVTRWTRKSSKVGD